MLKITELRVGNYLYFDQNILVVVTGIYKHKIKVSTIVDGKPQVPSKDWSCFIEGFKPVKLNEKLLLHFGFTKGGYDEFIIEIDNGWRIIWQIGSACIFLKYNDLECEVSFHKYQYLHELQNLYRALTGKELEITIQ